MAASASTMVRLRSIVMRSHIAWTGSPARRTPAASLKSYGLVSTSRPSMSYSPSARLYPRLSISRRCSGSRGAFASGRGIGGRALHGAPDRLRELRARLEAALEVLVERLVDDRVDPGRQ